MLDVIGMGIREKTMSKAKTDSILEYTRENTIGDPYVSEPILVKSSIVVSILKGIGKVYMWLCTIAITLIIIQYLFRII